MERLKLNLKSNIAGSAVKSRITGYGYVWKSARNNKNIRVPYWNYFIPNSPGLPAILSASSIPRFQTYAHPGHGLAGGGNRLALLGLLLFL